MCLLAQLAPAHPPRVALAWDDNGERDIAGYILYCGTSSHNYPWIQKVARGAKCTVERLTDERSANDIRGFLSNDVTYFFAVASYTADSVESPLSEEVAYTVPGPKGAPMAVNDSYSYPPHAFTNLNVLANDSIVRLTSGGYITNSVDASSVRISSVTSGQCGEVTVNSDQTITYRPFDDSFQDDSFHYTLETKDINPGAKCTALVMLTNTHRPPVARNDEFLLLINNPMTNLDLLANDAGDSGSPAVLRVVDVIQPASGFVLSNGGTQVAYQPRTGFVGTNIFYYIVESESGLRATGTVTVRVSAIFPVDPLPPITHNPSFTVSWPGTADTQWYVIYVQKDEGSWYLWTATSESSILFTGEPGHSYAFRCAAFPTYVYQEPWSENAVAHTYIAPLTPSPPLPALSLDSTVTPPCVSVTWPGEPGFTYVIEATDTLKADWTTVRVYAGADSEMRHREPVSDNHRFFRLRVIPSYQPP
jgi:hypothetical protein